MELKRIQQDINLSAIAKSINSQKKSQNVEPDDIEKARPTKKQKISHGSVPPVVDSPAPQAATISKENQVNNVDIVIPTNPTVITSPQKSEQVKLVQPKEVEVTETNPTEAVNTSKSTFYIFFCLNYSFLFF
eukprot:TRINITY_DN22720_c0_g1_i1.p1 TRINITY_DN22720_c0_g1~~TRINITY_DN22720_c0_g1_i1.p1  ORF type:complete len:132 (+),score=27.67 TRINITY_DN22720_c0_g1_i1:163-558(+)